MTINKDELFRIIISEVTEILKTNLNGAAKLKAICKLLENKVPYYDWVGFYAVDKERTDQLVIVSFEGEPTEHVRISFGKGICGQAASLQRIYVVQDVSKEANYLSCSSKVKSEIVIPILKNDMIVGELDIDSHVTSPFTSHDKNYLAIIAKMASELF